MQPACNFDQHFAKILLISALCGNYFFLFPQAKGQANILFTAYSDSPSPS